MLFEIELRCFQNALVRFTTDTWPLIRHVFGLKNFKLFYRSIVLHQIYGRIVFHPIQRTRFSLLLHQLSCLAVFLQTKRAAFALRNLPLCPVHKLSEDEKYPPLYELPHGLCYFSHIVIYFKFSLSSLLWLLSPHFDSISWTLIFLNKIFFLILPAAKLDSIWPHIW